ncbi:MAG: Uma2 family endonuclease [Blastocatellia bacterium]
MSLKVEKHAFTEEEYQRIGRARVLRPDVRTELIEGEIVEMSPIGEQHAACVKRINFLLSQRVTGYAIVSVQDPLRLDDYSEPQPDLMLLRPRQDFYSSGHPGPDDLLLLIEVSDTSLAYDREVKLHLYARPGIPEVWIVDLASRCIEVHSDPSPQGYRSVKIYKGSESVSSATVTTLVISVDAILGSAYDARF